MRRTGREGGKTEVWLSLLCMLQPTTAATTPHSTLNTLHPRIQPLIFSPQPPKALPSATPIRVLQPLPPSDAPLRPPPATHLWLQTFQPTPQPLEPSELKRRHTKKNSVCIVSWWCTWEAHANSTLITVYEYTNIYSYSWRTLCDSAHPSLLM